MTNEEMRFQVALSCIQGVLEAKHGIIGEIVPSVAVKESLRIADEFVKQWLGEHLKEQKSLKTSSPELCESEDEKIRTRLIALVEAFGQGRYRNEMLVYLEKQKEPEWSDIDREMLDRIIERGCCELPPHTRALTSDMIQWLQWMKEGRIAPKQEEQKPTAEERIENDKHFLSVCQHLETLISESKNDEAKEIDKDYRWLCEFYRKVSFCIYKKPAEWSERYIADVFENVGLAKIVREQGNDELTNAVQSAMIELSKGNKQEWSEEDEAYLGSLINYFEGDALDFTTEEICSWLNSLRPQPHWKPSEEQMEALESAVKLYKDTHFEIFHERIVSLYEQLKKLM